MTDKVQKIRKEVERIQLYTQSEVLKQVLDYIDKVQEEPVSVWHNMDEVPIKGEVIVVQTKDTFYGLSVQKGGTTYKNRNKDKYVRWAYASDLLNISDVQRTIKNSQEPVSEELEEAAEDYAATGEILPNGKEMISFDALKAFKAGAEWQKEQFEKNHQK